MVKKKTHGGRRSKSGRKPVEDKKVQVTLYVRQSHVDQIGLEELKAGCYEWIEDEINILPTPKKKK